MTPVSGSRMLIVVDTSLHQVSSSPTIFERIAPRYDLANTVLSLGLHRRWKLALIRALEVNAGDVVLDAGTGTGDLAHLAAARGARVIGVDMSAAMLAIAAQKAVRARPAPRVGRKIALLRGDLSRLPLADGVASAVASAFVLRHLPDLGQAFRELRRVLVPGGRIAVLEFGTPRPWIRPFYNAFSFRVIPTLGGRLTGDPRAYEFLVRSIRSFPEPAHVAGIMQAAGFAAVRRRPLSGGIAVLYTATTAGASP